MQGNLLSSAILFFGKTLKLESIYVALLLPQTAYSKRKDYEIFTLFDDKFGIGFVGIGFGRLWQ
jgi:hypothetical protein